MKYDIGDKVRIKTWEQMEKEFGLNKHKDIDCYLGFNNHMERGLNLSCQNRIVTIDKRNLEINYAMKEIAWCWTDEMIECLANNYKPPTPISSRFEILDL